MLEASNLFVRQQNLLNAELSQFSDQFYETLLYPKSWKPLVQHLVEVSRHGNAVKNQI